MVTGKVAPPRGAVKITPPYHSGPSAAEELWEIAARGLGPARKRGFGVPAAAAATCVFSSCWRFSSAARKRTSACTLTYFSPNANPLHQASDSE